MLTRAATETEERPTIEALFRKHFDDVYRMVARLLGPGAGTADIEDVTQQVFMIAQRILPKYRGEGKETTWLYGISSRVVMNNLRSWRRQRRLLAAVEVESTFINSTTPEHVAANREELQRVWLCLMRIKPKKRIVYVMHEIEGLSGVEIAEALEIPVATVWTRLRRARQELLAQLERQAQRDATTREVRETGVAS